MAVAGANRSACAHRRRALRRGAQHRVAAVPTEFRICYAGKLYPKLRTPDIVFAAVAELRRSGDPAGLAARFDFYGEDPNLVAQAAARYGLADAVTIHGEVERIVALSAMR